MKNTYRLKENSDFRRAFQRGKSVANAKFVLYWSDNRTQSFRVGFSVSKKIGNAVVRNRMKRALREVFHKLSENLSSYTYDFVVICRKGSENLTFHEIESEIVKLLRKGKFMV